MPLVWPLKTKKGSYAFLVGVVYVHKQQLARTFVTVHSS